MISPLTTVPTADAPEPDADVSVFVIAIKGAFVYPLPAVSTVIPLIPCAAIVIAAPSLHLHIFTSPSLRGICPIYCSVSSL